MAVVQPAAFVHSFSCNHLSFSKFPADKFHREVQLSEHICPLHKVTTTQCQAKSSEMQPQFPAINTLNTKSPITFPFGQVMGLSALRIKFPDSIPGQKGRLGKLAYSSSSIIYGADWLSWIVGPSADKGNYCLFISVATSSFIKKILPINRQDFLMVGVSGFEPEASWTRTKRDTKLRHTPLPAYYNEKSPFCQVSKVAAPVEPGAAFYRAATVFCSPTFKDSSSVCPFRYTVNFSSCPTLQLRR